MRQLMLATVFMLSAATAQAADDGPPAYSPDPPIQTIPAGDDKIETVSKGKPAPFSGQLYSSATALRWANWLVQYRTRLVQDVGRERELCTTEVTHQQELRDIEAERNRKVEESLKDGIKRSEQRNVSLQDQINDPSFFRSMEFGLILGVTATVVGVVAIAIAVN